jgi:hypothetical protein
MPVQRTRRRPPARPYQPRPKRSYGERLTQPGLRTRPRLRAHIVIGVVLLVVAAALVPTHLAEHAGVLDPLPGNREDIFLGFPMAGALFLAGFVALIWR